MRAQAYQFLNELRAGLPPGRFAFAAGDFNTIGSEDLEHEVLDRLVRPQWIVAHDECTGCKGSYYYSPNDDWSFLDMILWSRNPEPTWQPRAGSVSLVNATPDQVSAYGTPAGFELGSTNGSSDHWPLAVTIELAQKP